MKQGMLLFLFIFAYFGQLSSFANEDELEDFDLFLENAASSKEAKFIDTEAKLETADFDFIDKLHQVDEDVKEHILIKPKVVEKKYYWESDPVPFHAQLQKGAILEEVNGKRKLLVKNPVLVKAQEKFVGSPIVFILNKKGEKAYTTDSKLAVNVNRVVKMKNNIDPLKVYMDKDNFYSNDEGNFTISHLLSYHLEAIQTDYYATIFRGESTTAFSNTLMTKHYFLNNRLPFQLGVNLNYQFGSWEDEVLGIVAWQGIFYGPSIMYSFWKNTDTEWNLQFHFIKSLYHESNKDPDVHTYSTIGYQIELEKEFMTNIGPFAIGVNYRWSRSSIKETTEYLENLPIKGQVTSFGAYLSYRVNWLL